MSDPTRPTCYVTTPIYYVNDKPHIGHIYTTTLCDAFARFHRFLGKDTFFLTGTDEHGQKVEKSAQARGITPQALADENAAEFQSVLATFGFTNDDFIRTTNPAHQKQVQAFVQKLLDNGSVYLGEFEGWYDEGQEEYHTETKAKELNYLSPISKKPLVRAKEKNYYFRLSAFQKRLEDLFAAKPGFVMPEARRNEVLGRLREGLQDVPVSRTNFTWGIRMPGGPGAAEHVIYVWIDALFNYISALGLGDPASAAFRDRSKYWPATYHVVGKEILWFHAVIWPALLMALDIPLPEHIYAHSFWISEGQKMSKSLGNFIDLAAIRSYLDRYGLDAWRYYLCTQGPLGATDADFAAAHFHSIYGTDLVNTVGNCSSRVTAMIGKYFDGKVPTEHPNSLQNKALEVDWPAAAKAAVDQATFAMGGFDHSGAVDAGVSLLRKVDAFINATEPYKIAKDANRIDELGTILYQCIEAVRIASLLLWHVMPGKMEELWKAMGIADAIKPDTGGLPRLAAWGGMKPGMAVLKVALFPRVDATQAAAPSPTP